jgi:hypothetical protein
MERYNVKREFHLSVLGRSVPASTLIEIHRPNTVLRANGRPMGNGAPLAAISEAIRVITALTEQKPELIERLPEIDNSQKAQTQTIAAFPAIGCLKAAEEWLGEKLKWNTTNEQQEEFIELFLERGMAGLGGLGENEVRWKADAKIGPINEWLKENGFDISLTVEPGDGGFAVASILDVLVEWLEEGERRKITNENGTFDGVHLKRDKGVGILQNAALHDHPVARITTKSGDKVYMTPVDGMPEGDFALESKIRSLTLGLEHEDHRYSGVVFPMVDYDQILDVSFLKGLNTNTVAPGFYVAEAVQQTKFRMNEKGARVESAMAMTFRCRGASAEPTPLLIDQPFLLWIVREGVDMPLFGGVFAEDVWADPKTLD